LVASEDDGEFDSSDTIILVEDPFCQDHRGTLWDLRNRFWKIMSLVDEIQVLIELGRPVVIRARKDNVARNR
jgi:hypothetical protein